MITPKSIPTLEEFLAAPDAQVAAVAPETLIFAVGGTRRAAALAGISPQSDDYARWSRTQMMTCIATFFRLGVRHLFTTAIRPGQLAETGRYRERLLHWVDWGLAGSEALAEYARHKWRVHLLGTESLPELQSAAERVQVMTQDYHEHTLWWYVVPDREAPWQSLLTAVQCMQSPTRADLIRAMYGEDVPLATMYVGFGKPMVAPDILPPILAGEIQCYWPQRPGYTLDEALIRRIFYDYAYLRPTWRADRAGRYDDLDAQRAAWETQAILGVGQKLGDFWYPGAFPAISTQD